ncbi:hypothetical protein JCM11251_004063 [Rhodosporidiobolus azoricus]
MGLFRQPSRSETDDKHSLETEPQHAQGPQAAAAQAEAMGEKPGLLLMGEIDQSLGVARIEAINEQMGPVLRGILFFGTFLVAYTYGLDATVRGTLQSYATSSFATHSLLATVNVLKSTIAAASYPAYCKIADTFGRIEVIIFSIVMYVVGTIVESQSHGIKSFCAGAVIWQFGYSASILIVEVVISDLTSLRSRLFFSYIPALPFIINTWVSGDITESIRETIGWRAGIGLWAGIYPAACLFMIVPLFIAQRRARKAGRLDSYLSPYQQLGFRRLCVNLFWELDLLGTILLLGCLILILLPFTLAGGVDTAWKAPHNIAMLVVGVVVCVPSFIVWERYYAKVPAVPFHLLNNRTVLGCLGLAVGLNTTWYMQGDYIYTVLVVGMNESVKSATRISSLYSFASVITGTIAGIVVRFWIPRLKYIIITGVCIWYIAFGLLIRYRGGEGSHDGIVGAQVMLGIAGGLFPYPAQTLIQTAGKHQHTAILLTLYLSVYNYGSAIGGAISGAIWTRKYQVLPDKLNKAFNGNTTEVEFAYGQPFEWIVTNTWETPQRQALVGAYREVQKILCIAGICLAIPLLAFAFLVKDPKLGKEQSLPDAEGAAGSEAVVRGKK